MSAKGAKIMLGICIAVFLMLVIVSVALVVFSPKDNTVASTPPVQTASRPKESYAVKMTYTFKGAHAEEAGFAEGEITITPADESATNGYYLLYFGDEKGLLAGYDEFASIPVTGENVTHTVKDGTFIPPAATRLVAFESEDRILDEQPDYKTRVSAVDIPQNKRIKLGTAAFTFGAISDVHMNYEYYYGGAYAKWEAALNFFAAQKMDKVIVTGDMTGDEDDKPLSVQYQTYLDIIEASDYPLEDIHECIGNHGNTIVGRKKFVEYTSGEGEERPTEDSPWFSVLVEGKTENDRDNLFLFMAQELHSPGESARKDNFSKEQIDWLEQMVETYADTDTNIFLSIHSPFLNYGAGDREDGDYTTMIKFDSRYVYTGRLKKLIEANKNIIIMSGHTHLSLYDGENYSDENGKSCRMIHVGSGCYPATYQNEKNALGTGDGRKTVGSDYGSEAYTVAVYEEYIVYTGHNLSTGKIIPSASYILPVTVQ